MPTYDYQCGDCNHRFEIIQKMTDEPLKECPACHKETLKRGFGGGIGVTFKGSGFYATDYANPSKDNSGGSCGCGKKKGPCHS
jgi:putative FmdB family regulatory protein